MGENMKKLIGLLTVLVAVNTASATSIMGTTLSFQRTVKSSNAVQHSLQVYVDGTVVDRDGSVGQSAKVVARLTGEQMDRLNRLIRRATPAVKRFEASNIKCFAPSFTRDSFTANNFQLLLREGAACDGGFVVNVRPAAQKLLSVIAVLEQAAHNGMASAAVDAKLHIILD
jgi:hypothetical protein